MSEPVPEYYGDVFSIRTSPWGVAVTFGVAPPTDKIEGHDNCVLRVGHETAKTVAMMLRRQLKQYERDMNAPIAVPQKIMNDLGLAPEDW
jgi:hypothetical protein